jgi:hypothetical protein
VQQGRGPFGEKGFRLGLAACVVLVVVSPVLLAVGGDTVRSVATSLLVVGVLGLAITGTLLLAERAVQRRRRR